MDRTMYGSCMDTKGWRGGGGGVGVTNTGQYRIMSKKTQSSWIRGKHVCINIGKNRKKD